ncbi:unnamed protein product [Blepharisma stoltei]|uniref:Hpc2-related domain-containing protein n=1 Tax=Blepharisma stoltei TaxID=1481888 RepID=A0AAU9INN7_9CILI|nr:unnamed protein product [Blepharisma stoltei]
MDSEKKETNEGSEASTQNSFSYSFKIDLSKNKVVSYASLVEEYNKEHDISDSSSDESEESHSYPVFMQGLIERLEKYGYLALSKKIGQHRSKIEKIDENFELNTPMEEHGESNENKNSQGNLEGSEESYSSGSYGVNENLYDLDDDFIDDEHEGHISIDGEREFWNAEKEGYYVISAEEFHNLINNAPASKSQNIELKRKRSLDLENVPDKMKHLLEELDDIYDVKSQGGIATAYPRGAYNQIGKIGAMIQQDEDINSECIYKIIENISGLKISSIINTIEKYLLQMKKTEAKENWQSIMKTLKNKLAPINRKRDSSQLEEINEKFKEVRDSLMKHVKIVNEFNEKYKRGSDQLDYLEEERRFINEIKFNNANIEVVDGLIRLRPENRARSAGSILSPSTQLPLIDQELVQSPIMNQQPTESLILNQEPAKGKIFEKPTFCYEDFYNI